jgi:hypothetical protein
MRTMIPTAAISAPITIASISALVGLFGVVLGLWVNGDRAERQRRRELHSRALAAVIAYGEMPFRIRRRRHEESERSSERIRLSEKFSAVQAEIATCRVLLNADGDARIAGAYGRLVEVARGTAGAEAHQAWKEPAIESDSEMNMAELFGRLTEFRSQLEIFEDELARATLPRRLRLARRIGQRKSRQGALAARGIPSR